MLDFIERLRAKPEHVRRRVAVGTAVGVSSVVAVVWLFTLVLSGTLILGASPVSNTTLAQTSGGQVSGAVTQTKSAFSQLVGAADAAFTGGASTTPALTIEDPATTTAPINDSGPTAGSGGSQTQIPF
jgi:hypothetical protein